VGVGVGVGEGLVDVSVPVTGLPSPALHRLDIVAPLTVNVAPCRKGTASPGCVKATVAMFPLAVPLMLDRPSPHKGHVMTCTPATVDPVWVIVRVMGVPAPEPYEPDHEPVKAGVCADGPVGDDEPPPHAKVTTASTSSVSFFIGFLAKATLARNRRPQMLQGRYRR
jgi:hypothetical protein